MPSASLVRWLNERSVALAEINAQYATSGIAVPPSPRLVEENLRGSILLLAAHFQGFCRDLYTECTQVFANAADPSLQLIIQRQFGSACSLDKNNANLDSIRKDFERFGLILNLGAIDPSNYPRLAHLKDLNSWRNIVAHQGVVLPPGLPAIGVVQSWGTSCGGLAVSLDEIMYDPNVEHAWLAALVALNGERLKCQRRSRRDRLPISSLGIA